MRIKYINENMAYIQNMRADAEGESVIITAQKLAKTKLHLTIVSVVLWMSGCNKSHYHNPL